MCREHSSTDKSFVFGEKRIVVSRYLFPIVCLQVAKSCAWAVTILILLFASLLLTVLSPVLFVICAVWIMSTVSLDLEKTHRISENLESVSLITRTDR